MSAKKAKSKKGTTRRKSTRKKAARKVTSSRAAGEVAGPAKGLEQVLAHAQGETRQQLSEAIEKKQATGQSLMDILRQDVDREMFSSIWGFLNKPIELKSGKAALKKTVGEVLLEDGVMTADEWAEAMASGDAVNPELAKILVETGHVTEEQLDDALAQQERSGQSFWRILMNRGLVSPKQIADLRKFGAQRLRPAVDEAALTQMLVRTGLVTERQCREALAERKRSGGDMFQILLDSGAAKASDLGPAISKELGVAYVDLKHQHAHPDAVRMLPEYLAEQHRMIPIEIRGDDVLVAMTNPQDMAGISMFQMMVNMTVKPALAFEKDVLECIHRHHRTDKVFAKPKPMSHLERLKARLHGAAPSDKGMIEMAENVGVINLVASIVEGAIHSRATDIHLEPQANALRVRYRIDGMLYDIMNLPEKLHAGVVSRVKVLAGMDITERRHPQDGHFDIDVMDRKFDLRVATVPTVLGEKVVLRLLNTEDVFRGPRELGLEPADLDKLQEAIDQPHGMILATGPTGSGKTTTLYAALSQIDILTQNVITIEDPVEYQLPGINQIQVDLRVDRTFASMLRSALRQDADVMMVGEIRDEDTARVAVRAAMTGHLVFSTLHTNSAVGAVATLGHLGIQPYLINGSLVVVVAQRLVRRVCPVCREAYKPQARLLRAINLTPQAARNATIYRAVGCEKCYETGYRGRSGIFEILRLTDELRGQILAEASEEAILKQACAEGMLTLLEDGVKKVLAGVTTIEEILRVTTA